MCTFYSLCTNLVTLPLGKSMKQKKSYKGPARQRSKSTTRLEQKVMRAAAATVVSCVNVN